MFKFLKFVKKYVFRYVCDYNDCIIKYFNCDFWNFWGEIIFIDNLLFKIL